MDVGSVYGSYYETAKSYMGLRKEEKQAGFAEKVTDKSQVSSEDMTLEEYKEYFNEKMNSLYTHPSQRNRNASTHSAEPKKEFRSYYIF